MARSKSKHQRVKMKIRQKWKARLDRKKAAAPAKISKAKK